FREQAALIGADEPQIVRAAALHETQIIGVVDDAGKVGVLVVNPHRHDVAAGANLAVERVHRQGTRWRIAASQFFPSNCFGAIADRSISSRQRTLTSILSGSERGT